MAFTDWIGTITGCLALGISFWSLKYTKKKYLEDHARPIILIAPSYVKNTYNPIAQGEDGKGDVTPVIYLRIENPSSQPLSISECYFTDCLYPDRKFISNRYFEKIHEDYIAFARSWFNVEGFEFLTFPLKIDEYDLAEGFVLFIGGKESPTSECTLTLRTNHGLCYAPFRIKD